MMPNQHGAVLPVSLIILLVLTLLVMSSSQTVILQERMTAAVREGHIALSVAEAAIDDAEAFIEERTDLTDFNAGGDNGYFSKDNGPADFYGGVEWENADKVQEVEVDDMEAQYIIVDLGEVRPPGGESSLSATTRHDAGSGEMVNMFRIVARATGRSETAPRLISVTYGKKF